MNLFITSALFTIFTFVLGTKPPKWDASYVVKGTLNIPYAEISEPFSAWFDRDTRRSRIDYYGGMVKTFQIEGEFEYGTLLKLVPITTKLHLSETTCFQVNGTSDNHVHVQSILPDTRHFKLISTENFLGFTCDKFVLEEMIEEKKNLYVLWVRYIKSSKYPGSRMPIPVRYEMRGYNTLLGSHYDHYFLDYESYNHEQIPNEIFELNNITCHAFSGQQANHHGDFNPMREFIYPTSDYLRDIFFSFKKKHNLKYKSREEHIFRENIFRQNLRYIHSFNRAKRSFSLSVNHLADKTDEEIATLRGFKASGVYNMGQPFHDEHLNKTLPNQFDWRLYGAITPVKDQSVCGSCWAFGTIGTIEGAYFLKNGGNLVRLSQQALIDCSWQYGNNGCDGGEDFRAYQWIMESGGVPTEDEYGPYLGQDGYCHTSNLTLVAGIKSFVNVTSNNTDKFKLALVNFGPLSIAIDASPKTFSFYSHGIYYDETCKNGLQDLDHAVLAVGYGTLNGENYWLVKNSWSTYWGNDGYVLISARDNNCGVLTTPTYVQL